MTHRRPADWPQQKRWLEDLYPHSLSWFFSFNWQMLSPWPWHVLWHKLNDIRVQQWRVTQNGQLQGILSWVSNASMRDDLWLAAPQQANEEALIWLLRYVQKARSQRLELRLDHPYSAHRAALEGAGFRALRNLLWMQAPGKPLDND
jgi:hypothetical protein